MTPAAQQEIEALQAQIQRIRADIDRLQPDQPRYSSVDARRSFAPMRSTATGLALLTSGRLAVQMVATTGDRPTDAIDGQLVHVRADQTYVWNAESGAAGAWEAT